MKIAIIGRGNVATHLIKALQPHYPVVPVNPRTLEDFPADADLALISVSDSAIISVAERLNGFKGIVAHTSGSTPMTVLAESVDDYGVFYPLQTFSKDVALDYAELPFFIEGGSERVSEVLRSVASSVSEKVYDDDSDKRRTLHIASVFACNYVNHMLAIADELLKEKSLDISVLRPLIAETIRKVDKVSPRQAQTGPAVRRDQVIIDSHLAMLADNPRLAEIYRLLALSIQEE